MKRKKKKKKRKNYNIKITEKLSTKSFKELTQYQLLFKLINRKKEEKNSYRKK